MPLRKEENRTKKILFGALLLFVLASSIIGFSFSAIPFGLQEQQGKLKYNGIELTQTQTGFQTAIDGQILEFTYLPADVQGLNVSPAVARLESAKVIYATSHPNSSIAPAISGAEFDMARMLEKKKNSFLDTAFTEPNIYGKAVITCREATPYVPVIYFNMTNTTTSITEEGSCIIVNAGSETDFERIRDKIIYELLGIK